MHRSWSRADRTSRSKASTAVSCAGIDMAAVAALESLLATQTLWHAGRSAAVSVEGEPTGYADLDALLPQRGWPRRALTELLLPADGVGELSLLIPTLGRFTQAGATVALIAPPYQIGRASCRERV